MMRFLWLIYLIPFNTFAAAWSGVPPNCWSESRNYHSSEKRYDWKSRTKIARIEDNGFKGGTTSPNNSYAFKVDANPRPNGRVTIYSEQKYLIEIVFSDLNGLNDVRWINEKLIFMRVWWGRIAATDIIYDVEKEAVIYVESVTDGYVAFQQYKDSCKELGNCQCEKIKRTTKKDARL